MPGGWITVSLNSGVVALVRADDVRRVEPLIKATQQTQHRETIGTLIYFKALPDNQALTVTDTFTTVLEKLKIAHAEIEQASEEGVKND